MILIRENAPALLATLMYTGQLLRGAATHPAYESNDAGRQARSAGRLRASNSHYGPVTPRRVPSPGVPISSIMRIAALSHQSLDKAEER
jgi:hypothetical protein